MPAYLINGKPFNHLAHSDESVEEVVAALRAELERGEVERMVVNLADSDLSPDEVSAALDEAGVPGLLEVIFIAGETVQPWTPAT